MLANVDVHKSAFEQAKQLLITAFSGHARINKLALRIVQRALKLAVQRGYEQAESFAFYFRNPGLHTEKMTYRWLMGFFEFVSADELCQLANA